MPKTTAAPPVIPPVVPTKSNGDCRTCAANDPRSAPPSCTPCAWRRARDAGRAPIVLAHELMESRTRRSLSAYADMQPLLEQLRGRLLHDGRYYVWVDTGGDVIRTYDSRAYRTVETAEETARFAAADAQAVWVVSVSGLWQVRAGDVPLR